MPSLFIPHGGGPCFFMDWRAMGGPADAWDKTAAYLKGLIASLPQRPKGIVVISGTGRKTSSPPPPPPPRR
jgi:hypothetical protein